MFSIRNILVLILCLISIQTANADWTRQDSGTLAWLRSVYFVNQQRGWIVGSAGTILNTTDGGKTWKKGKKFTEDNIRDVYFLDEQSGWLLCEKNIYSSGAASLSYLMATSNGGNSWQRNDFPGSRERMVRLFFGKSGTGFAVGEGGAIWRMQDDKKTWRSVALPVRNLMLAGAFTDDLNGILVGGGGTILFTGDGGSTWNQALIAGGNKKMKLNAVFFADQRNGWASGAGGSIYFTNNGGHLWREQIFDVPDNLSDIFFIDSEEGYAVGDNGIILHTTTGGNSWTIEKTGTRSKLERVFFIEGNGIAVGYGGTILTWSKAQMKNATVKNSFR